ncbi:MAG: Bifunctional folate synthesis protein [candidate division BRC1 bacterium ADurb.BinA292]|nr:MAG: Bifunctional folate synthesis protein [candidate division BRC1 bacterium ADurb.BinA292]
MVYHPYPIVLGLGSNIGPGRETFRLACRYLDRLGVRIQRRSRLYWTRPWGVGGQPPFQNAAVAVRWRGTPERLLDLCLTVERELGRRRRERWGPRRLDLDLLLFGSVRRDAPGLTLPHPWIARRDFVLAPLIDLQVPPLPAIAPAGWGALLAALPAGERAILRAERWP